MSDPLERFSPVTRAWFMSNFAAPTPVQAGAWDAIATGANTLIVAPTGSGKTLAAFLSALDTLASTPRPEAKGRRCRVLYISPLKALAVDVERNLTAPLVGMRAQASRLGLPEPDITVSVRSGDTPQAERRRFLTHPSDILITTPESLFLLLTSKAREVLAGVQTVILDEVHALAGSKRGAHLGLSLERLDALLETPAQRIGLSATVRPLSEVARFVGGSRPVTIVDPPSTKTWDLTVSVPVPDMSAISPRQDAEHLGGTLWPHVEHEIVDLIAAHHSTLVFCNSRRLAERLTARLNEIWQDRHASTHEERRRESVQVSPAAQIMAQSGSTHGAPPLLARAHHGSVSKDERTDIEQALKSGRLPAVVATSSLELGIDMGAVDLVIQVEAPPSVASGLQRIGRAGHQVGATSEGRLFPKFRGDLISTTVVVERMRAGLIEELRLPSNPLDVLAQQIVAICAMDPLSVADLGRLVRGSANFTGLPESALLATLDMLTGRYPSDEFAELRPRLIWDRHADVVSARPGAARLAIMSGGTIPDRGLYGVFLASGEGPGRRVGELDEEMVYESRVGDVFALGSSSWRIEEITHDRVLVTPAPGMPARLPFWKGESLGRPAELGEAHGAFLRELTARPAAAPERLAAIGLDQFATDNLLSYLAEQRSAIASLPTDTTLVLERFRDELGDWRVCLHSPYGGAVHAPWALALRRRVRDRFGVEIDAMPTDDGIVFRMPSMDEEAHPDWATEMGELLLLDPREVGDVVTDELGGSSLFAARFRECSSRALLLPRQRPDKRQALWQQRLRSAQLLEVAARYPSFPLILETVREILSDLFDLPALERLLGRVRSREVQVVQVETSAPSPFARTMSFGYLGQFMYDSDQPLAERRAAALTLDPTLLAELLGRGEGASLRDLLDADACRQVADELQWRTASRRVTRVDDVTDLLRSLGPLSADEIAERSDGPATEWIAELTAARRIVEVGIGGRPLLAVAEDSGRLRDALGVLVPRGVADAFLEPTIDPLGTLLLRHARTHLPFGASDIAEAFGLGVAVATQTLDRLVTEKALLRGEFLPDELTRHGVEYADPDVVRRLRRRSVAVLRQEVEAVSPTEFARFLPRWHGFVNPQRGAEGVLAAVEQLAGAVVPASALETLLLPARVASYDPRWLDELLATGEVFWQGQGALGHDDGFCSLHLAGSAPLTLAPARTDLTDDQRAILEHLQGRGALLAADIAAALGRAPDPTFADDLWALVWAGGVSSDGLLALRARLAGGSTAHRAPSRPARGTRLGSRLTTRALTPRLGSLAGRWFALPKPDSDDVARALAGVEFALEREGILTRGAVEREGLEGGFATTARILRAAEDAGRVRRGYFVEGLGGSQFATAGAVDRLRAQAAAPAVLRQTSALAHLQPEGPQETFVLAATDPANAYGAALGWPVVPGGHKPGRKAGAVVVLVAGELVLYVERGGRTLLSFTEDPVLLQLAATALAEKVTAGALGTLTVARTDGAEVLGPERGRVAQALERAGFRLTPQGLRLRPHA